MKDLLKTPFAPIVNASSTRPPSADVVNPRLDTTGVMDQETYQSLEVPKLFGVFEPDPYPNWCISASQKPGQSLA